MAALPSHTKTSINGSSGSNMGGYGTAFGGSGADGSSGAGGNGVSSNQAIRVVVVGDKGTGKTSLIVSSLTDSFPDSPVPVLPPTRLLPDMFTEKIPLLLVDTSSRREDQASVEAELRSADAVVVVYACQNSPSLHSVSNYWLPLLQHLQVSVPVVVAGCKSDLHGSASPSSQLPGQPSLFPSPSLDVLMAPIMDRFADVETCLECSALKRYQVTEVFFFAQRAVLHPTAPLFDRATQTLKPACVRALMRIFLLCDTDNDGVLSDNELNAFQVECFGVPLQPAELAGVKRVVAEKVVDGVAPHGLTLPGFFYLHALFIERGRLETTWTVLRKFGYASSLRLRPELLRLPQQPAPDQSVELSPKAFEFICSRFHAFDADADGALSPSELNSLFCTAPSNPWEEPPYAAAAHMTPAGALPFSSYVALWSMMALLHPHSALEHLLYLGFPAHAAPSALSLSRRRKLAARKKPSPPFRRTVQCFVLGPRRAGKSALLDALLGRPFDEAPAQQHADERFACALLHLDAPPSSLPTSSSASSSAPSSNAPSSSSSSSAPSSAASSASSLPNSSSSSLHHNHAGSEDDPSSATVLVLREVSETALSALLQQKDWLAQCDVAAFVYDSSSQGSWERAVLQLQEVAQAAEATGWEMPAVLVAAKNDMEPHPAIFQHSARLCADMGVMPPIPVSSRLRDVSELWSRIVTASRSPHVGVPETSAARNSRELRRRRMYRSTMIAVAGVAVAAAVIISIRVYSARRSASS